VFDGAAYSTPLGQVPVDRAFAAKLATMSKLIKLSGLGHTPTPDKPEHALEDQLPFLQRVLGQFQLVPIIIGDQSYETCRALGLALAKLMQGTNTLIVASSDLSHYHPYAEAVKIDHKTLKAIEEWDYLSMARNFDPNVNVWEACGGYPIIATMIASERLGASQAKVLDYANSGDVAAGDKTRVVGYGAVAFVKAPARAGSSEAPFSLSQREKDELLKIARKSVESAVRDHKQYEYSPPMGLEALEQERGAFVTLNEHGQLRGCIGYVAPMKPLAITVRTPAHPVRCLAGHPLPARLRERTGCAGVRSLGPFTAPPGARRQGDPRGTAWPDHEEGGHRRAAAPPGSGRRKVGPRHFSGADLLQGRPAQELLAGCRHRHLPVYRAGLQLREFAWDTERTAITAGARLTIAARTAVLRKPNRRMAAKLPLDAYVAESAA